MIAAETFPQRGKSPKLIVNQYLISVSLKTVVCEQNLYERLSELIPDVESALLDAKKLVVTGRNGSADRMLLEKISPLDEALERLRSFSKKRLWIWSRGLIAGWIIFLITGAMAALQLTAAQSEKNELQEQRRRNER